jgi:hypothetical protein
MISFQDWKQGRMSILITLTQHSGRSSSKGSKSRKRKHLKSVKKMELSLFVDNIIIHIENPKEPILKIL